MTLLTLLELRRSAADRYASSAWFRLVSLLTMVVVNWAGLGLIAAAVPPDAWFLPIVAVAWMVLLAYLTIWLLSPPQ